MQNYSDASPHDEASLLLDHFEKNLQGESRLNSATINKYIYDCRELRRYLQENGSDVHCVDRDTLEKYMDRLKSDPALSDRTVARKRAAFRRMYKYFFTEGDLPGDPSRLLESVSYFMPLPRPMTEAEVVALLAQSRLPITNRSRKNYVDKRLIAVLELLYATGMRITECMSLPIYAVQFTDGLAKTKVEPYLTIKGKRGKERRVPLISSAVKALEDYLAHKKFPKAYHGYLFPGEGVKEHITRQYIARQIKAVARSAGIPEDAVRPHLLRHSFATHLLKYGASVKTVKELLGHSDVSSTQIYTHVLVDKKKNLVDTLPLNSEEKFF